MFIGSASLTARFVPSGPFCDSAGDVSVQVYAEGDSRGRPRIGVSTAAGRGVLLFDAEQLERAVRAMRICAETDATKAGE